MDIFKYFYIGIKAICNGTIKILWYFVFGLYNVIMIIPNFFIYVIISLFGKKNKNIKKATNKKISFIIMGLSVLVYLICVFYISRWYVQGLKIKYLTNDIISSTEIIETEENNEPQEDPIPDSVEEPSPEPAPDPEPEPQNNTPVYYPNDYWDYMEVPFMNVNFDELLSKNSDTVGWIKVEGTKVNYPVVQADNNDYYLSHAFNKKSNAGGWVFADYRDDFDDFGKNTIIYGHNMNNKTMFGSIPQMLNKSYLNNSDNYYIKISTPTCNTVWKLFSIYTIEPEIYYLKTNFRTYSFEEFINTLKGRSVYNFGINVNPEDKILTLSTCDNTGTKRVAVHAKMISIEYK